MKIIIISKHIFDTIKMKKYPKRIINLIYTICSWIFFLLSCKNNNHTIQTNHPILIIQKKCGVCHRTGEAGPFSLITYKEIKHHANKIKYAIEQGIMPPWPADTNYSRFANELILTKSEKESILEWIATGCPLKDTGVLISDMPIKKIFQENRT